MKSSLDRDQMMGVAGAGLILVGAGLAGWFGLSRLGEVEAEVQVLAEKMGNPALAALLADPNGPGKAVRETEELRKLKDEVMSLDGNITAGWAQAAREAAGEGQDWSKDPGRWKDRLIEIQSRLQKESTQRKVILPPDFYLGLQDYRQKSPAEQEVPELALRLSVAERLVTHLFLARQTGEQYPTVCEFQTLAVIGPLQEKPGEAPVGRPAVSPVGPERKSFRIEIRCSPEVLYDYVRRLTLDSWLFILTDLTVTNERQTFPLRSQVAKSLAPAGSPDAASAEKTSSKKKLLEILAGEEFVTAVICLDFVNWKPSAEAVPAAASSP